MKFRYFKKMLFESLMNCSLLIRNGGGSGYEKRKVSRKKFFEDKNRVLNVYIDEIIFFKGGIYARSFALQKCRNIETA